MEVGKYKFSSDFKAMSEGDFIKEMKSRFKTKVKDAREIYNTLHGNGTGSTKEDSSIGKEVGTGEDGVQGAEETQKVSDTTGEGEA